MAVTAHRAQIRLMQGRLEEGRRDVLLAMDMVRVGERKGGCTGTPSNSESRNVQDWGRGTSSRVDLFLRRSFREESGGLRV